MIIDLTKLNSGIEEYTTIDLSYSFSKEELKDSEILELNDVKIYGTISKNSLNDYYLDLEISGIMVLPCAVTLKPVNHDFNIKISERENYMTKSSIFQIRKSF